MSAVDALSGPTRLDQTDQTDWTGPTDRTPDRLDQTGSGGGQTGATSAEQRLPSKDHGSRIVWARMGILEEIRT